MATTVKIPLDDGYLSRGWLAQPEPKDGQKMPGVLVIHELTGLVDNIGPVVDRFAANGYTALAPDLFDRKDPKPLCVARTMTSMMTGKGRALADIDRALAYLGALEHVDENRLAAIGFCMGGGFALLLALDWTDEKKWSHRLKASAPNYGNSLYYMAHADRSCPVVGSYGDRDLFFRDVAGQLNEKLSENEIAHDVRLYPDSGHSFITEEQPGLAYQMGAYTPMRVGYNPDDAEDAWQRILAFFKKHV